MSVVLCLSPSIVFADTGLKGEDPMEITADSLTYDKSSDTYYAEGNVIAVQGNSSIRADKMTVDMDASHATAIGNVEAHFEQGNTLKGDSLELDIDTKVGVVINGRLFFKKGNVHVTGEEIRKTGDESYSAHKGFFTTCDCEPGQSPAWGFYSSDADVTFGEYLTAWNSLFYVKAAPVFYFPYLVFPVKRERQTGFLSPEVGYSKLRGFKFDNSFFWAISDSTDATFYFDIENSRGIGEGIEYRYALTKTTEGQFYFYHFKENDMDRVREFRKGSNNLSRPKTADDNRWFLEYKHRGLLPYGVSLNVDVKKVSDDEYFIDFGKDTNKRSLESLESNISLTKTWSKFNLVTQFRYFDNLLIADNSTTLQRLPEIALTGIDQQIMDTPFHFGWESSFVNFDRKEGATGQRIDMHPTVSLPLNPGGYFEFKPSAGVRETFYQVADPAKDKRYYDRSIYDLGTDVTTTFVNIFPIDEGEGDGLKKLKHTIRPKIIYTYIPDDVQDDLPIFDGVDRIGKRNDFTYSLNTILTGKFLEGGNYSYRDYIYMDLSQIYNINETTRKLTSLTDKRRPFSDVTGEIRLQPLSWTLITAKGKYDAYEGWMNEYDASLGLWDKRGDRLDTSYRYTRIDPITHTPMEYLELSLIIKPVESIDLTYHNRYSYNDKETIEAAYGLAYRQQCWGAQITYTERLEEKMVMLTFNLLGIGQVGGLSERVQ
ncbi:MAG: LPS assembly protein LptD [Deltaproteobacteria bacterium]|nr:LPS assembly protein LptD [Deltaproteobacteria bacterium]